VAKKRAIVNLSAQKLTFTLQNIEYKLLSFCPNKMIINIAPIEPKEDALFEIPFAHLSKELKKIIKPN